MNQHTLITLVAPKISNGVDQILAAKKHTHESINQGKDPNADTSTLEREIDIMVNELYGLIPEEIEIVGERSKLKV